MTYYALSDHNNGKATGVPRISTGLLSTSVCDYRPNIITRHKADIKSLLRGMRLHLDEDPDGVDPDE